MFVALPSFSQKKNYSKNTVKQHITFVGIPLGIPMDSLKGRLHEKGFTDGEDYNIVNGDFWKIKNARISLFGREAVNYVSVNISSIYYVPIIEDMRKKYGTPQKYVNGSEHQFYWDVKGGRIVVLNFLDKIHSVEYWDYPKVEKEEKRRKEKQLSSPTNDL